MGVFPHSMRTIMYDVDEELTTYLISPNWKVRYTPWYGQTAAAAEYMSKLDGSYGEDYMKLAVI